MSELFPLLNNLSYDKQEKDEKWITENYEPFLSNRYFSLFLETILYANELNGFNNTTKKQQYDYYFYSIPKRKRFTKWPKRKNSEELYLIAEYFKISPTEAKVALEFLTTEQIEEIKQAKGTITK